MIDLYLLLVPTFSIITLLNILSLKLAIKDNIALSKIYEKKQDIHRQIKQNQEKSPAKNLLKHLLLNFTPVEFIAVRRAKYKLSFFLSISIILLATFFIPSPFAFAATGAIIYFLYFFVTMALTKSQSNESCQQGLNNQKQKYLQVIFTIISIVLNFVIIGKVFKNYQNSLLSTFMADACINIVLDNFVIRPLVVALVSFPLSLSSNIQTYLIQCQKNQSLLQIFDEIGQKQMLTKPKKMFSPSKIPKTIPLQIQIEPIPVNEDFLKKRQQDGYERPIDILKKIKKQKILPPININLQKAMECENSLNSLFNSTKKEQHSDANDNLDQPRFQEKKPEDDLPIKQKNCSENLIMVNPSHQQHAQDEEDIATEDIIHGKFQEQGGESFGGQLRIGFSSKKQSINHDQDFENPVKISLNSSEQPSSRQQPLRICLNGALNLDFQGNEHEQQDIQTDNFRKRRQLLTLQQNSNRNTYGALFIKEHHQHHQSEQIQEIDLNSPERRKRQQVHVELEEQSKLGVVKKKKKKFSHDNRVIKFSTGEPYLQYLPNMLSKDNKGKKSQAICKKDAIIDSRASNSVKRPKKRFIGMENNQNIVPEFRIEEL